jgi:hypothetical protein
MKWSVLFMAACFVLSCPMEATAVPPGAKLRKPGPKRSVKKQENIQKKGTRVLVCPSSVVVRPNRTATDWDRRSFPANFHVLSYASGHYNCYYKFPVSGGGKSAPVAYFRREVDERIPCSIRGRKLTCIIDSGAMAIPDKPMGVPTMPD